MKAANIISQENKQCPWECDPERFQVQVYEKLHLGREIKDSASHEKSQLYEMLVVKLTFM